jgi:predicted RNase H-like HicB family nuclease
MSKPNGRALSYTVTIQKSRYGYHVECPALPGCVSQGDSLQEALDNIKDAIHTYLLMIEKETRKHHTAEVQVAV